MDPSDIHVPRTVHPELDAIAFGIADIITVAINRQTARINSNSVNKPNYVVKTLIKILENAI